MAGKAGLSRNQQETICSYMRECWDMFPHDELRHRWAEIDRAVMRQRSIHEKLEEKKNGKMKPVVVPVVQPQTDTFVSQLTKIFISPGNMFQAVSAPENDEQTKAINALLRQHETVGAYAREFILWIRDASKYNLHAMEVSWASTTTRQYANSPLGATPSSAEAMVSSNPYYYNRLKRISPYNLFYDRTVDPAKVHEDGEFVGYHEQVNFPQIKKLMQESFSENTMNFSLALASGTAELDMVWDPSDTCTDPKGDPRATSSIDWVAFANTNAFQTEKNKEVKRGYILTTLYFRSTPSLLGIRGEKDDTIRVYKVLIVNSTNIIYFGEQTAAHGYFPIVMGQPVEEGLSLQTPTFVENVKPIQDLVSTLHTSRVADLARALSDRGIYDPLLVDGKFMNSANVTAKIPLKPYGQGRQMIGQAYYQIPYRADAAASLMQEAQLVTRYGEDIGGLNPVQRGSFVKGNKTLGEFQTIMGNADDRMFVIGLMIEVQSLTPIKEMLKSNILQYQGPATVFDSITKKEIDVNPATLRQIQFAFQIADGLKPTSMLANSDNLATALQFIAQSPQLQQSYDLVKLFAHIYNTKGAVDLESFRLQTPFVQQAPQQPPQPGQAGQVQQPPQGQVPQR